MSYVSDLQPQSVYADSEFAPLKRVVLSQSEQASSKKTHPGMGLFSTLMELSRGELRAEKTAG